MDNLTHSLVGALIGQAGLKRKTGLAMPALIIGANLPDVDAACFFWLEGTEHLGFRRGITHGPPALVLLPLILAGLLYGFDRWQARRGTRPEGRLPVSFKWLFLLSFIGCLTHPALDWLNVYGIRLLEPFSSQWFYGDTLFIIDVWLWALMGFAVWFSLRREKRGGEWMKPARWAMVVALGYIGLNGVISARASDEAERAAQEAVFLEHGRSVIASPVPLAFWERETIYSSALISGNLGSVTWNIGDWSLTDGVADVVDLPDRPCNWIGLEEKRRTNSQLDAFLF
jgi:inner membrane protein